MEMKYRSACGRYEVMFDEKSQDSLFAQIAKFQEIFEDDVSVVIEGTAVPISDIKFRTRKNKDGDVFYEKVYSGSNPKLFGYKMEYGNSKEDKGSLFPKRKDKDNNYYKNGGWHKWEGPSESQPQQDTQSTPAPTDKSKKAPF
jgi:hypothetical protein